MQPEISEIYGIVDSSEIHAVRKTALIENKFNTQQAGIESGLNQAETVSPKHKFSFICVPDSAR